MAKLRKINKTIIQFYFSKIILKVKISLLIILQTLPLFAQKKSIITVKYPENYNIDSVSYSFFNGEGFKETLPDFKQNRIHQLTVNYYGDFTQLKISRSFLDTEGIGTIYDRMFYTNRDTSFITFGTYFLSGNEIYLGNSITENITDLNKLRTKMYEVYKDENELLNGTFLKIQSALSPDSIFFYQDIQRHLIKKILKNQLEYISSIPKDYGGLMVLEHLVSNSLCLHDSLLLATCQKLDSSLKTTKEYELLEQKIISSDCYRWGNLGGDEIANLDSLNQKKIKRPSLRGLDVNENEFDLDSTLGRRVLLNFWATWCGPCILEIPEIIKFKAKYPEIEIISVAWDTEAELVKTKMKELGITWKVIMMNEFIKNIYEIQSVPKSFFINEYGLIDAFFNGLISFEEMENSILNKN